MIGERMLLRIYLLSTDQVHPGHGAGLGGPAFEWIVGRARKRNMAGATVLRGIYGSGSRGETHRSAWRLSQPEPVIAELVDEAPVIARFLEEEIAPHVSAGMITLERAAVMMYRRRESETNLPPLELPAGIENLSTLPAIGGSPNMKINEDGILLRIFAGDSDQADGKPLYQAIVHKARELGLAGATVLKGSLGFGANSVLHTAKIAELSTDMPIVIEIVDAEENIRKLLPFLDKTVAEGMITMESVQIIVYRHNTADGTVPPPRNV